MGAVVYMLLCADGSYYVGNTSDDRLDRRLAEHNSATYPDAYTSSRRPVTLVWSERFDRITDAIAAERQLKGWSRIKKQALVRGDWSTIVGASKRRGGRVAKRDFTPSSRG
jgi:putative endonuclease